ncbi:MAG: S8 family serine peptidase [Beijerinckiaceae bacterium]
MFKISEAIDNIESEEVIDVISHQILLPSSFVATGATWSLTSSRSGSAGFTDAWRYATGLGVSVSIVDNGVNRSHADLAANYDRSGDFDPNDRPGAMDATPDNTSSTHGTQVAGIIAGNAANDVAGVGAATGAMISASVLRHGTAISTIEILNIIKAQAEFDVSNNSWGIRQAFGDNFQNSAYRNVGAAMAEAAATGRDGLGTVFVFAAGNGKLLMDGANRGDDSNFHNLSNSRFAIAVGASDDEGKAAFFSSPGANVLISAPGVGLVTTDGTELGSERSTTVSGTSFAAPLVSSAIALMLEVNPLLGVRDIQEILALTAKPSDGAGAHVNAASHANGGGLVFDRELGFGTLDAEAAVLLARTWTKQSTVSTQQTIEAAGEAALSANPLKHVIPVVVSADHSMTVEWARLHLTLGDQNLQSLRIELVSPAGTRVVIAENLAATGTRKQLNFEFSSVATRGEDVAGTWLIELSHPTASAGFSVYGAVLKFDGQNDTPDDIHVFTDAWNDLASNDAERTFIRDEDGGIDTLNFAASKTAAYVDLDAKSGVLNGVGFQLSGTFENVFGTVLNDTIRGSDGQDTLNGEDGSDLMLGERGSDTLNGGAGDDYSFGGEGDDRLNGGAGSDILLGEEGNDLLSGDEGNDLFFGGEGNDTLLGGDDNDYLSGDNNQDEIFGGSGNDALVGGDGNDYLAGEQGQDVMFGGNGNDVLVGSEGNDYLSGDAGENAMFGGTGDDIIVGGNDVDYLSGDNGKDLLFGGGSADSLLGDDGEDIAFGGLGDDYIDGGADADILVGEDGNDVMVGGHGNDYLTSDGGNDTLAGGAGTDALVGGAGADYMTGDEDFDVLIGGEGSDMLFGGAGADALFGDDGDDFINGGEGADYLVGGNGNNIFAYSSLSQSGDAIVDFVSGKDKILIEGFNQGQTLSVSFGDNAQPVSSAAQLIYNTKTNALIYDANGDVDGGQTTIATFANGSVLTLQDFLFV